MTIEMGPGLKHVAAEQIIEFLMQMQDLSHRAGCII
jgi:hypothetical protein